MGTISTTQSQLTANGSLVTIGEGTNNALFRFTLPTVTGTITAAALKFTTSALYATPTIVARCHKSAYDWSESSNSTVLRNVVTEMSGKSSVSSNSVTTNGAQSFSILGSTGSSGTGILRAYELGDTNVTVFLRYGTVSVSSALDATSPFKLGAQDKFGSLTAGMLIYGRGTASYATIEITYDSSSGTRSIFECPILISPIVR